MADISNSKWSENDETNNAPSPDGVQGGYSPNTVAPILRATRGAIKRSWNRINAAYTVTGSATSAVLTFTEGPVAYVKGERYAFWASVTNTGAITLNINGLGAKNILRSNGTALTNGDILAGSFTEVVYDGTVFRLVGSAQASPTYSGTVTANSFSGSGASLTNLNATNLATGTLPDDRFDGAYTKVQSISASGAISSGGAITSAGRFKGADASGALTLSTNENGKIYLRPNGDASTVNELIISADGTLTFNGGKVWHINNDGAASGMDADLLDGQQGTFYQSRANHTGTQPASTITGLGNMATRNATVSTATPSGGADGDVWYKI